jgi:LPS-assembly lipoprotein
MNARRSPHPPSPRTSPPVGGGEVGLASYLRLRRKLGAGDGAAWLRSLFAASAFALTGCGFHPLYGDGGSGVGPALGTIFVEPISDRVGYELRNDLLDLLNFSGSPETSHYRLKLYLTEREDAVVLQANTSITRYNYTLTAHYELTPKGSTDTVKMGDLTAFAAYNVAAAPFLYATATAQRDAHNRAADDIAERLRTELAVYLRTAADQSPSASAPSR